VPNYPLIEFILSVGTWDTEGEALPDTGFEGGVAIPYGVAREIIADPDLVEIVTADGTLHEVDRWSGVLELDGHRVVVEVIGLGHQFLIGREVLDQLEICFEYGRRVRLTFGEG